MEAVGKIINPRKIFLINKPFQLSIIGWFSFLAFLMVIVFYTTIWYFFYNFKKEAASAGLPPGHVFFTFLNEQKMAIDHIFIFSSSLAILLIVIGGLILSHKVAGPIYQLTEHLKKHSKENIPPLQFRKGDYFMEIPDALNDFIKRE